MAKSAATGLIFAGIAAVGVYLLITNWKNIFPSQTTPPPSAGGGGTGGGGIPPPATGGAGDGGGTPPPVTGGGGGSGGGGTIPPATGGGLSSGDVAFLQALDTDSDGIINDAEMIKANQLWTTNQSPFNVSASEGDRLIRLVTRYWTLGTSYR